MFGALAKLAAPGRDFDGILKDAENFLSEVKNGFALVIENQGKILSNQTEILERLSVIQSLGETHHDTLAEFVQLNPKE